MTRASLTSNSGQTLRTFIAIELDHAVRRAIARVQDGLAGQTPHRAVRWVRPDGIHLTLKFLGDTPEAQVSRIGQALMRATAAMPPMDVTVSGLGCFPNLRRPRVLWLGLQEPHGALKSLWKSVERQIAPLGWETESRGFHPHLTLGRVNRRASGAEVRAIGQIVAATDVGLIGKMRIGHVSFIRSTLKPTGAEYDTLAEAKLLGSTVVR